jgi:hypothetical protein
MLRKTTPTKTKYKDLFPSLGSALAHKISFKENRTQCKIGMSWIS